MQSFHPVLLDFILKWRDFIVSKVFNVYLKFIHDDVVEDDCEDRDVMPKEPDINKLYI